VTREEILAGLGDVFCQVLGREVDLAEETTPAEVEGWDSLAHVTLILATEKRFGVKFTGAEIANAAGIGALIALIEKKLRH